MEDLVNTLSFQCWNRVPYWGGQVGMAVEVVISGRKRGNNNTFLTQTVADIAL